MKIDEMMVGVEQVDKPFSMLAEEMLQLTHVPVLCRLGLHRGDPIPDRRCDHEFLLCRKCGATPGHWFFRRLRKP